MNKRHSIKTSYCFLGLDIDCHITRRVSICLQKCFEDILCQTYARIPINYLKTLAWDNVHADPLQTYNNAFLLTSSVFLGSQPVHINIFDLIKFNLMYEIKHSYLFLKKRKVSKSACGNERNLNPRFLAVISLRIIQCNSPRISWLLKGSFPAEVLQSWNFVSNRVAKKHKKKVVAQITIYVFRGKYAAFCKYHRSQVLPRKATSSHDLVNIQPGMLTQWFHEPDPIFLIYHQRDAILFDIFHSMLPGCYLHSPYPPPPTPTHTPFFLVYARR